MVSPDVGRHDGSLFGVVIDIHVDPRTVMTLPVQVSAPGVADWIQFRLQT